MYNNIFQKQQGGSQNLNLIRQLRVKEFCEKSSKIGADLLKDQPNIQLNQVAISK